MSILSKYLEGKFCFENLNEDEMKSFERSMRREYRDTLSNIVTKCFFKLPFEKQQVVYQYASAKALKWDYTL